MIRKELITDLTLEAGGALQGAHVVYHTSQEAWDGRKPVIWICHALTANSDPEDWRSESTRLNSSHRSLSRMPSSA